MIRIPQSVPIGDGQIRAEGGVLARAFLNDPLCVYTQPDREARMNQFIWLFTQLAQEGAVQGGVYADTCTDRPDGVAIWMPPQANEPKAEVSVWSEMDQ